MKKIIAILVLITSTQAFAREAVIEDLVQEFDGFYQSWGKDNNYLDSVQSWGAEDTSLVPHLQSAIQSKRQLRTRSQQIKALQHCVFITRGAYGVHFSQELSKQLSDRFLSELQNQFILMPDLYFVPNWDADIFNNNCAVLLHGSLNDEIVIVTGAAMD